MERIERHLARLYERTFGAPPVRILPMDGGGSGRQRFRLEGKGPPVIGVGNDHREENAAFIGFSRHFRSIGLPVPEIFAEDPGGGVYLETDLGDHTLADRIAAGGEPEDGSPSILDLCKEAVRTLPRFQVLGGKGLDFSLCYQGEEFDEEAMRRDLDYFRDCFLGPFYVGPVRRDRLDEDFRALAHRLAGEERTTFLYRDFQPRNILVVMGRLFFVDYQSGRRGALPYDIASFLTSASAPSGAGVGEALLAAYLAEIEKMMPFDRGRFLGAYPGFVLIRRLQALGAYGNLGVQKGKEWFLGKIPRALQCLKDLLEDESLFAGLPELADVLERLTEAPNSLKVPFR